MSYCEPLKYRTYVVGTKDGKGSIGQAMRLDGNVWKVVGETKTYWTYPAAVRARSAAQALVRQHLQTVPFAERIGRGHEIENI